MPANSILLVLPITAYRNRDGVFIDTQACNGLRLWGENFDRVVLACPTIDHAPPDGEFSAIDTDETTFVSLPSAYSPRDFLSALRPTIAVLQSAIDESDYLHFAIGGLLGDWASVAAILARRKKRRFAIWTDRVESAVMAFQAKSKVGLKRFYYAGLARCTKYYERQLIRMSDLGLFHGMDCFDAYARYSRNPHLVHNVHLDESASLTDDEASARIAKGAPMSIIYVGRAHRDKGVFDWIEALTALDRRGVDFRATWFGGGPELTKAVQMVQDRDLDHRITFAGPLLHRDLIACIKQSHLFVFCHKTQESPRCLLEALICGVPLIGYDSPYPRQLIEHGGGILTAHDPKLVASAIMRATADLAGLTQKARADGREFDSHSVFRHRSDLMKSLAPLRL